MQNRTKRTKNKYETQLRRYVGAIIRSISVATGRSLGCGYRVSDMFVFIEQNDLKFNNWNAFYTHNPQILDKNHNFRNSFGLRCKSSAFSV